MKLQQLRYVREIARRGFSVSAAANALHTSQPGVSNQVQQLEDELGLQIFERHGKRLTNLTSVGHSVVEMADRVLLDVENIHQLAADSKNDQLGTLSIGTTHTQARYALPKAIKEFSQHYPNVHLNMVQGTPTEIAEMAATGRIDLAIATEGLAQFDSLAILPCYDWNRSVVVPPNHPLLSEKKLTLKAIAQHPILTYVMGFTGRAQQDQAFIKRGLHPNVVFTATDADVIKTYVELELGVGIIASMAFDPVKDSSLKAIDASHLFKPSTTHLGIRRGSYLRGYSYAFIEFLAPHLTKKVVEQAIA
ncbi:MAG: HTH-type transcriptional regulator CysB [Gammaproteobacteria bacterium]|nr:MAG: HTH-type transcriptional regulator CysB [Gammaproteobacteria bacterium]RKZ95751.1 MAG: HTH-type transcriptional regulator CysB [Gammaproteobacteria bacterium]RKZ98390.1 MAG: HTH-type transcriptional regulator CysB [Gammaproteobacteria bacterium]RKZ99798.1 MAG: HTH-type transcriptional regulator CysB [Gammaproteobacteria bacterium]HHA19360.1 HTH-type transcriptional regulator CysB [Methylophaga sp.]